MPIKKLAEFRSAFQPDGEEKKATPAKNKNAEMNRVCFNNVYLDSYHAVSHSQREKVRKNKYLVCKGE